MINVDLHLSDAKGVIVRDCGHFSTVSVIHRAVGGGLTLYCPHGAAEAIARELRAAIAAYKVAQEASE